MQSNILNLLEQIRSIAQLGLLFTKDKFDRERYTKLLELASNEYSELSTLPSQIIMERFRKELGYITPKTGVNGVIFNSNKQMLLERRADDGLWGIPGGWAEIGESPQQSVIRELFEETGLTVEVTQIIDIFTRLPGDFGQPHTSYHILFLCKHLSGNLTISSESRDLQFWDINNISNWHRDHGKMARKAYEFAYK